MKKTIGILGIVLLGLTAQQMSAFCIYNKGEYEIEVWGFKNMKDMSKYFKANEIAGKAIDAYDKIVETATPIIEAGVNAVVMSQTGQPPPPQATQMMDAAKKIRPQIMDIAKKGIKFITDITIRKYVAVIPTKGNDCWNYDDIRKDWGDNKTYMAVTILRKSDMEPIWSGPINISAGVEFHGIGGFDSFGRPIPPVTENLPCYYPDRPLAKYWKPIDEIMYTKMYVAPYAYPTLSAADLNFDKNSRGKLGEAEFKKHTEKVLEDMKKVVDWKTE